MGVVWEIRRSKIIIPIANRKSLIGYRKSKTTPTMETTVLILLIFLLVLAIFLGLEVFSKTPADVRLPLLSGANAVSGVIILGAILTAGLAEKVGHNDLAAGIGGLAVALAAANAVGGYVLTDRLLTIFRKKDDQ